MQRALIIVASAGLFWLHAGPAEGQTLRGSPRAMQKQNRVALEHDYTFLQTSAQVRRFVELGLLVHMPGNQDYALASVSHPVARPAIKLFVERLAAQYRAACGEKLVITSLTRPVREQPRNASNLSVHPAGMAVDLRVPGKASCRSWLERTLMSLERQGVLDAIRENRPPHYHVALFPEPYTRYVARITRGQSAQLASAQKQEAPPEAVPARAEAPLLATANLAPPSGESDGETAVADHIAAVLEAADEAVIRYRINRGDTLWSIARRHGTTVEALRRLNGLSSNRIVAGQRIAVPSRASSAEES
jgi:LysM repeat protein